MVITIKFFKGATHVDKFGDLYVAKTTCVIKSTPTRDRVYLTNGKETTMNVCFDKVRNKKKR